MLKFFFAAVFLLFLYLLTVPIVVKFIPNILIKVPTVSVEANKLLRGLDLIESCEPLECSNIYVFNSSEDLAQGTVAMCQTDQLTPQVQLSQPLYRLGSCNSSQQFFCTNNSIIVKVSVYSLIPYPQKLEDFYYCK